MSTNRVRMSAAALIGVIIMSAVFCQAAQVHAKSENIKTRLVSRVVISSYDSQSKKWTKDRRTSFAYKKAYPVKKVDYYYDGKTKSKYTFKYAKTKISPYRYSQMMSNILMEQNNYYEYLWY